MHPMFSDKAAGRKALPAAAGAYGDADGLCEWLLDQLREGADDASDAASARGDADMGGSSDSGEHGGNVPDSRASRLEASTVVATLLSDNRRSRSSGRQAPSGNGGVPGIPRRRSGVHHLSGTPLSRFVTLGNTLTKLLAERPGVLRGRGPDTNYNK